jgi:peptidyl-prolyl cis-trans isomerase B (cyclophilin B)
VAGSLKRERQLAREHYERQQARRSERAAKKRRFQQVGAVLAVAAVIVAGVVVLANQLGGDDKVQASGSSKSGPASAGETAAAINCKYPKAGEAAKDAGVPLYDPHLDETYRQPFSVQLATNRGNVRIALDAAKAPCTSNSFRHLVEAKYYDDTSCHRLTTSNIFVLQCGDPTGTGSGGPGYQFGSRSACLLRFGLPVYHTLGKHAKPIPHN